MPTFDWSNALIQIPVVGAFMWFALTILKEHRIEIERLLDEQNKERERQAATSGRVMDSWAKYMDNRDTQWRLFLEQERIARAEGMARLAEEIKTLTVLLNTYINNSK